MSSFAAAIQSGRFIATAELNPPKGPTSAICCVRLNGCARLVIRLPG